MDFLHAIDGILDKKQCDKYIKLFDNPKNVELVNTKNRKYFRVVFIDKELAEFLFQKVESFIPKKIRKQVVGMNKYIRLSKYQPGQFFGIHKDGINKDKEDNSYSYATLNIFLNDNFEGGETTFYERDKKTVTLKCKPKMGRGSFFYSQQFHEGNKLKSGYKYLLRTDLMLKSN